MDNLLGHGIKEIFISFDTENIVQTVNYNKNEKVEFIYSIIHVNIYGWRVN